MSAALKLESPDFLEFVSMEVDESVAWFIVVSLLAARRALGDARARLQGGRQVLAGSRGARIPHARSTASTRVLAEMGFFRIALAPAATTFRSRSCPARAVIAMMCRFWV